MAETDEEVNALPLKKHGHQYLLGEHIDQQLQLYYLEKIRDKWLHYYSICRGCCCPRNYNFTGQIKTF